MRVTYWPGEAPGAIANGSRVRKAADVKGDAHPAGSLATVLSSIRAPDEVRKQFPNPNVKLIYFVEWDDMPGLPVGIVDWKIEKLGDPPD